MLNVPMAALAIVSFAAAIMLGGASSLLVLRAPVAGEGRDAAAIEAAQIAAAAPGPAIALTLPERPMCEAPLSAVRVSARARPIGGPFTLAGSGGAQVSDASFRGCYMVVFFGFTHCPDVCPAKLEEIARTLEALGPAAGRVAPVFISVDPERDTPDLAADYAAYFDRRIVGLSGTPDQVFEVAKAYRAYYQRVDLEDGSYVVDHSALVYLMGPDGAFREIFRPDETPDAMAAKIAAIIEQETGS